MVGTVKGAVAAATFGTASMAVLGDFERSSLVFPGFHEQVTEQAKLFGKLEDDRYQFRLEPREGSQVFESIIYFDVDQNLATTSNRDVAAPLAGYELYAFVTPDGVQLFEGCAPYNNEDCRTELGLPDDSSFTLNADNSVEFAFEQSLFGGAKDIDIAVVLQSQNSNGNVVDQGPGFLSNYYSMYSDINDYLDTPCQVSPGELRGAVLYDDVAKEKYFDERAYVQLMLAMQNQVRQAGMPYDLIRLSDLLDISNSCQYTGIVIPMLKFVEQDTVVELRKALHILTQVYGVGIVTNGDFVTNAVDSSPLLGNPYYAMTTLFGIQPDNPVAAQTTETKVQVDSHYDMFWDKDPNDLIMNTDVASVWVSMYRVASNSAFATQRAAKQTLKIDDLTYVRDAIRLQEIKNNNYGRSSGRMVHFSTASVMGNSDTVWRALVFIATKDSPVHISLQDTRFDGGIFTCRNDMDQSQYIEEAVTVSPALLNNAISPWYQKYNFVASYYINVGNDPDQQRETDWDWARSVYGDYIDLENEIGSHTYTHPSNINALDDDELDFEFGTAQTTIRDNLGLSRLAAAQPGLPDVLATALKMEKYMSSTYFSGGYSSVNAGYPGAFGFLAPEDEMVYVAPNMQFDFSLMLLGKSPSEMEAHWKAEIDRLSAFSGSQIYHWPVHDYAITEWDDDNYELGANPLYSTESFENTIAYAATKGVEFATTMQLHDRIRASQASKVEVTRLNGSQVRAKVTLNKPVTEEMNLGHHALKLEYPAFPNFIVLVGNHYAFSSKKVLLPSVGGTFDITYGSERASSALKYAVTRIVDIGMRMELMSVSGNGKSLEFQIRGKGKVVVYPHQEMTQLETSIQLYGNGFVVESWDSVSTRSEQASAVRQLVFNFESNMIHRVSISLFEPPVPEVTTPPPTPIITLPPPNTELTCFAKCKKKKIFKKKSVRKNDSCQRMHELTHTDTKLCGCDLGISGAVNPGGSIDLALACPDIASDSDPLALLGLKGTKKYERICAQLCDHEDCSRWTLDMNYLTCYLYTCSQKIKMRKLGSGWSSGVPCQEK